MVEHNFSEFLLCDVPGEECTEFDSVPSRVKLVKDSFGAVDRGRVFNELVFGGILRLQSDVSVFFR